MLKGPKASRFTIGCRDKSLVFMQGLIFLKMNFNFKKSNPMHP